MNNKITSMVCMGVFALGMTSAASANIINVLFGSSGASTDTVNYTFTSSASSNTATFDSAVFNVGGSVTEYTSANYNLVLGSSGVGGSVIGGPGNSLFDVFSLSGGEPIIRMSFDGEFNFTNGLADVFFYNDFAMLTGDFEVNYSSPLLTGNGLSLNTLIVSTTVSAVPVPAAVWLFGSGLIGLAGVARRKA